MDIITAGKCLRGEMKFDLAEIYDCTVDVDDLAVFSLVTPFDEDQSINKELQSFLRVEDLLNQNLKFIDYTFVVYKRIPIDDGSKVVAAAQFTTFTIDNDFFLYILAFKVDQAHMNSDGEARLFKFLKDIINKQSTKKKYDELYLLATLDEKQSQQQYLRKRNFRDVKRKRLLNLKQRYGNLMQCEDKANVGGNPFEFGGSMANEESKS